MIKDEYEILAFNDLNVAKAYLDMVNGVMTSLMRDFDPRGEELAKAYIGLYEFTDKYRHRMDDISAISGLIDKARSKHREVLAKLDAALEEVSQLREVESRVTTEALRLQELNLKLDAENKKIKETLKGLKII